MPTWNTPYRPSVIGAGARDCAVRVETETDSVGTSGFPVKTWSTHIDLYWCHKQDISGYVKFEEGQDSAPFQTRFEGPYREDLDPELVNVAKRFRFVVEGRTYEIRAASMIGRHRGIEFLTLARIG